MGNKPHAIKGEDVLKVADMVARGESVNKMSKVVEVAYPTMKRFLDTNRNNDDFKELVESYTRQHYSPEMLTAAHDNIRGVLKSKKRDLPWTKLKYQASKELMQGAGIYPSDQPYAINVLMQQNIQWNSPAVREILAEHQKGMKFEDENIVEGEVEKTGVVDDNQGV